MPNKGGMSRSRSFTILRASVLFVLLGPSANAQQTPKKAQADLSELSPEQLANLEVTSVSKRPEKQSRSSAAIYVITREDIRRSGVTSLADALRLAPGVQVARINSNQWAVGIRGFASYLSRSVLVLIDGRSVYTPLFAGTYWQAQDTLLEDVDRIEVIRGPGGTLWGANAVDGVINIITRFTRDTQDIFATVGGGTAERAFAGLRYGGTKGDNLSYRVYAKGFDRAPGFHLDNNNFDGWHMEQGGFRTDWNRVASESLTVQGDIYGSAIGVQTPITTLMAPFLDISQGDAHLSGGNLLAHWQHGSPKGPNWNIRGYYDRTDHREPNFRESRNTADVDLQRHATYGQHDVIIGAGYRLSSNTVDSVATITLAPRVRTDQLFNAFARDELSLFDNELVLAFGSKVEHNDYTGFEVEPSAQVLWAPTVRQSLWAAFHRAVRTPSRIETDLTEIVLLDPSTPTFVRLVANPGFRSETIVAIQFGYRVAPSQNLAVDATTFHNSHSKLETAEPGAPFIETSPPPAGLILPFTLANGMNGESYGAEITTDWRPFSQWRVEGSYSFLRLVLKPSPGSLDRSTAKMTNGSAPRNAVEMKSRLDVNASTTLDLTLRYVDALPALAIPSYVSLDGRLGWRVTSTVEILVVGENLLSPRHAEFSGGSLGSIVQVPRSVYGALTWHR